MTSQCELVGLPRSSYYYQPADISSENIELMRLIDEKYTQRPFFGSRRMTDWLVKNGYAVNRKRIQRLMRIMGIEAVYPKPRLSRPGAGHRLFPYLLRDLAIDRPDQVWCTDITYIRLKKGFAYLVAVMDWFSRYIISWELSLSFDAMFCIRALERALKAGCPEIFNSDQGSQFTSEDFTKTLLDARVKISMDGRGRAMDNIMIERLWRSLKYEEVYLKDYETVFDAHENLAAYFKFYNSERSHQSLGYRTPREVYEEGRVLASVV